jgi:hypothetical protein
MGTVAVPGVLPEAITRSRELVAAVLVESLTEMGPDGATALAWEWALTGTRPSPMTLAMPAGRPPSRAEILAEVDADPKGQVWS